MTEPTLEERAAWLEHTSAHHVAALRDYGLRISELREALRDAGIPVPNFRDEAKVA